MSRLIHRMVECNRYGCLTEDSWHVKYGGDILFGIAIAETITIILLFIALGV